MLFVPPLPASAIFVPGATASGATSSVAPVNTSLARPVDQVVDARLGGSLTLPDNSLRLMIPAGAAHDAKSGDRGAKIIATYVVEKGKPLATPAK